MLQTFNDLLVHKLLHLRSLSKVLYYLIELAKSNDLAVRLVGHMSYPSERHEVMHTGGGKGNVLLDNH